MGGFDAVVTCFCPGMEDLEAVEGLWVDPDPPTIRASVVTQVSGTSCGGETETGVTARGVSGFDDDSVSFSEVDVIENFSAVGVKIRIAATVASSCRVNDLSMSSTLVSSTIRSGSESSSDSGNESSWLLSKKETLSLIRLKLYSPFWR